MARDVACAAVRIDIKAADVNVERPKTGICTRLSCGMRKNMEHYWHSIVVCSSWDCAERNSVAFLRRSISSADSHRNAAGSGVRDARYRARVRLVAGNALIFVAKV